MMEKAQSLHLAAKLGMVKMGRVALDGTKLEAAASRNKAMSYGRLIDKEERIEAEIAQLEAKAQGLLADAEAADELPTAVASAARGPSATPRPTTNTTLGPGTAINTATTARKAQKCPIPNMPSG